MEKSRAIELLEHLAWDRDIERNPYGDALNMAIEALKAQLSQEGTTKDTTSDLISRQAAIDALWKALCEYEEKKEKQFQESEDLDVGDWIVHRIFVQNMNDIDRQTILNLPSAQPEPQEGHWKKDEKDDCPPVFRQFRICSVCGAIETSETNYCPNCGAKMKGERNETD